MAACAVVLALSAIAATTAAATGAFSSRTR